MHMNRLIDHLKKEDTLSLSALRALYRTLAVKCHPDISKKSGAQFVRLQAEYEEAVRELLKASKDYREELVGEQSAGGDPRWTFLRALYLFSIIYSRKRWKASLPRLLDLAKAYNPSAFELLTSYKRVFLEKPDDWKERASIAEMHEKLLSAIKQLAAYYESGLYPNKRLLLSLLDDLSERSRHIDQDLGKCMLSFAKYLKEEADGKKLSLMAI
jgi:curved DNA-binding protein CbpA